jgi:RNA polymerase sigma-70 factor (ECF subfamily)
MLLHIQPFKPATFSDLYLYYNIDMALSGDRALVKRTLDGDLDAYSELIRIYQKSVFNVCYRVLGNRWDAEDLTQESFLRAYNNLTSYDLDRPFGPWIRTLTANLCYNKLKRREPIQVPLEDEWDLRETNHFTSPEKTMEISQENQIIYQAIWKLPHQQRITLELRHFQGMSYQEMAETLDLPINTVRSHLYRGRRKLAELLKDRNHE